MCLPECDGRGAVFWGQPGAGGEIRTVRPSLPALLRTGLLHTLGRRHISLSSSLCCSQGLGLIISHAALLRLLPSHSPSHYPSLLPTVRASRVLSPPAPGSLLVLSPGWVPLILVSGLSPDGRAPGRSPLVGKQPQPLGTVQLAGLLRLCILLCALHQ